MGKYTKSIQLPKELHLSIWLETACKDANLASFAVLQLHEQGLLPGAGEVAPALERAICAAWTFLFLKKKGFGMCYTGKSYGVFTFSEFLFQIFSEQNSTKEKGLTNWCFGPQLVV